jgi:hypothetical protein
MGFDDLFEDKHKRHGNYREHSYHHDNDDHYGHDNKYGHDDHKYSRTPYYSGHGNGGNMQLLNILDKVRNSGKLKLLVVITGIVILIIAVVLIVALLPLIIKLINYVSQNGLQSIFDGITGFIDKLWKGSGK